MPIRTYTGLDFINFLAQFLLNNGSDLAAALNNSPFNAVLSSSGSNTSATQPESIDCYANYLYEMSGDLDFDVFPAIPENALITRVEVSIDITASGSASAAASGGATNNTAAGVHFEVTPFLEGVDNMPEITYLFDNQEVDGAASAASLSEAKHYTESHVFDLSGAPITKTQLEALFTSWAVQIYCESGGSSITG